MTQLPWLVFLLQVNKIRLLVVDPFKCYDHNTKSELNLKAESKEKFCETGLLLS